MDYHDFELYHIHNDSLAEDDARTDGAGNVYLEPVHVQLYDDLYYDDVHGGHSRDDMAG